MRRDEISGLRWIRRLRPIAFAILILTAPAAACPDCAEGVQARAAVWRDGFGHNWAVAALPFLIVGALCARAQAIGRGTQEHTKEQRRWGQKKKESA
jgi:hypothetical protein